MRFLACGDLHLGAGSDLGREPGERLAEQEAVWLRIYEMANELQVPILWAGDAWERRRPTPAEVLAFKRPLIEANDLVGVGGNHDVEAWARPTGYDLLDHCDIAASPDVVMCGGAQIARLPWAPPGHLVALEGGGDRDEINRTLAEGLVEIARGLFAQMTADAPRILLAHWSVGGATTPTGVPVDLFREPVLDAGALEAIGFDAVVLGHIHKPQLLSTGDAPMFYVGSPMPLNFGEAASEHCVWLLDVEPGKASVFQIPIESRRLLTLTLDGEGVAEWITGGQSEDALGITDLDDAIVKVKILATPEEARRIDTAWIKQALLAEEGAHKVWSVAVEVERPETARGAVMDESVDDVEAMARWLALNGVGAGLTDLSAQAEVLDLHREYLAEAAA